MKFLHPQFLWALVALTIPLLIHLFNFRRYATVFFSNNRLLQNIIKQSKSINRLRQWLIMLSRMLALAALVIAFANPYFPSSGDQGNVAQYISIYVDNSPSMLSGKEQQTRLAEARQQAVDIIKALPEEQKIQILTNDFKGRQLRFFNKVQAIELIDAIRPSFAFRTSEEVMDRVMQAREKEGDPELELYWISDFQSEAYPGALAEADRIRMYPLPLRSDELSDNVAIDSVWFDKPVLQPGFDQELYVQLSNSGGKDSRKVSLNLKLNDQLQTAKEVEIPAGKKLTEKFVLRTDKAGAAKGEVSIDAGDPHFDNSFFFSFNSDRPFKILVTGDQSVQDNFEKLYSDSIYLLDFLALNNLNYSQLESYDLIVLNAPTAVPSGFIQSLNENLTAGKTVALIPSSADARPLNDVLGNLGLPLLGESKGEAKALDISWNDPHFQGVFTSQPEKPVLPKSDQHFRYSSGTGYSLITLEDGDPLISRIPVSNGRVILFTTDLEHSDLLRHPIFVPIMLNAALYSRSEQALYSLAGRSNGPVYNIEEPSESPIAIELEERELIPRQRTKGRSVELYDLPAELEPGIYDLSLESKFQGHLAVNPPPQESEWTFLDDQQVANHFGLKSADILEANVEDLGLSIRERHRGTSLWKWFLVIALGFLIVETLLIKLWK